MTASVFQQVLGAEFYHLAAAVKQLHARQGDFTYRGRTRIVRGSSWLSRLYGWAARLPPAMDDAETTVCFSTMPGREIWQRQFGNARMQSRLWPHEGLLCERLGAVRFGFHPYRKDTALHWAVHRVHLLGVIPLPASWFDAVRSRESVVDGRYHFEVQASLPLAGLLVRYEGHLEPVD